jgi:hypothetical protein
MRPAKSYYRNFIQKTMQGISLAEEIFMEIFSPGQMLVLQISVPGNEYEYGYQNELDAIGKRIQECLDQATISGIKTNNVTRSKDAEIILELDYFVTPQVTINRRRGNSYRDNIGKALSQHCKGLFSNIHIEGAKGVNNRLSTSSASRPRFIDIRMTDVISGRPVNIEIKRGGSRYHQSQKDKDSYIEKTLKKGQTYVVRGTPARRTR